MSLNSFLFHCPIHDIKSIHNNFSTDYITTIKLWQTMH